MNPKKRKKKKTLPAGKSGKKPGKGRRGLRTAAAIDAELREVAGGMRALTPEVAASINNGLARERRLEQRMLITIAHRIEVFVDLLALRKKNKKKVSIAKCQEAMESLMCFLDGLPEPHRTNFSSVISLLGRMVREGGI